MNPKNSLIFFSVGVIIIIGLFLFGAIPMNIISESKSDNDHKEQLTVEETITIQADSKSIDDMDCTELNKFILSFEKGWGTAIPLYNEKCP